MKKTMRTKITFGANFKIMSEDYLMTIQFTLYITVICFFFNLLISQTRKRIVELDCPIEQFGWRSGEVLT